MKVGQEQGFPFSKCVSTDKPETFGCDCDIWKMTLRWSRHCPKAGGFSTLPVRWSKKGPSSQVAQQRVKCSISPRPAKRKLLRALLGKGCFESRHAELPPCISVSPCSASNYIIGRRQQNPRLLVKACTGLKRVFGKHLNPK